MGRMPVFRSFLWKEEGASGLRVLLVVADVDILLLVVQEGFMREGWVRCLSGGMRLYKLRKMTRPEVRRSWGY